jgi:hypothetical protein
MVGLAGCWRGSVRWFSTVDVAEKAAPGVAMTAALARRDAVTVRREIGEFIVDFLRGGEGDASPDGRGRGGA